MKKRNPIARVVTKIRPKVIPNKKKDFNWRDVPELTDYDISVGLYSVFYRHAAIKQFTNLEKETLTRSDLRRTN